MSQKLENFQPKQAFIGQKWLESGDLSIQILEGYANELYSVLEQRGIFSERPDKEEFIRENVEFAKTVNASPSVLSLLHENLQTIEKEFLEEEVEEE